MLAGGLVLGIGTTATLAAWTDNEYASTSVSAGAFGIVGNATEPYVNASFTDNPTGTPAALTMAYSTGTVFAPGTTATARFSVRLAAGSVPGTVTLQAPTITGAGSGANLALAQQMTYQVRVIPGTVAAPATPTCSTAFTTSPQGTLLTPATPPVFSGGTAPTFPAQNLAQTASPTIQHYCVQFALPTTAINSSQGGSFTATFTFAGST